MSVRVKVADLSLGNHGAGGRPESQMLAGGPMGAEILIKSPRTPTAGKKMSVHGAIPNNVSADRRRRPA